jgi:hypothetical protein
LKKCAKTPIFELLQARLGCPGWTAWLHPDAGIPIERFGAIFLVAVGAAATPIDKQP